jgi:DNA-binding transcriptional MocR family regulator
MDNEVTALMDKGTLARREKVVRGLLRHADPATMTTMPVRSRLAAETGLSEDTVKRHISNLRKEGLLGDVVKGALSKVAGKRNIAAVYVLCVPADYYAEEDAAAAAANDAEVTEAVDNTVDSPAPPTLSKVKNKSMRGRANSTRKVKGQAVIDDLRSRMGVGLWARHLSDRKLSWALRPQLDKGWNANDVLRAIDVMPDGTRWPHSGADGVKNVAAWLRFRLSKWALSRSPTQSFTKRREEAARRAAERRALAVSAPGIMNQTQACSAARQALDKKLKDLGLRPRVLPSRK